MSMSISIYVGTSISNRYKFLQPILSSFKQLTFERFSRFGFIMGFSETQIVASLGDFDFDVFAFISFDEFMMYYFTILV